MQEKIIQFLKDSDGYLSGETISRQLKISRSGIWKYMQELRREGYDIIAVPHLGYKLVSCPDKLLAVEICSGLGTKRIGKEVRYVESVSSTMDVAFQMGVDGAPEGTVVCADVQTRGRGRMGRVWISPKGKGVYLSIILRPPLTPVDAAQLTLMSAVAVCEAVERFCGVPAKIKWPNDILVGGKKLAGILTELNAEMDRIHFVVIGIGLNANVPVHLLPERSTSLKSEIGTKVCRVSLTRELLRSFEEWYGRLLGKGFAPVMARWKELSVTLGARVRLVDDNSVVEGQAVDLDEFGGLMIRDDRGVLVKRMSGDVIQAGWSVQG